LKAIHITILRAQSAADDFAADRAQLCRFAITCFARLSCGAQIDIDLKIALAIIFADGKLGNPGRYGEG
jgi:hypothetical protein